MQKFFKKYLSFNSFKRIKNNDLLVENDHLISYIEGEINKLRFYDKSFPSQHPDFAGIYFYLVLDLKDPNKAFNALHKLTGPMDSTKNLIGAYRERMLDDFIHYYKRLVFLDHIIVKKEYRGNNIILNEFIKTLKRDYTFSEGETLMLGNFQPIQHNYFFNTMSYDDSVYDYIIRKREPKIETSIGKYFEIDSLNTDYEYDKLKLHSHAQKNGFNVISHEKNIFIYS